MSSGRRARNKGARGEREVAAILEGWLGVTVRRNLGQAREGGDDITVGKFRFEVKRRETISMMQWCRQVEACTGPGEVPIVAFRQSGQEWRICMKLQDFLPLLGNEIPDPRPLNLGHSDERIATPGA